MDKELDIVNYTMVEVMAELAASKGYISDSSNSYADYEEELKEHFFKKYKKVIEFRRALSGESDRGCALFAASFLDYELENLLKRYLVEDNKIVKEVFSHGGALGTFSSRIDMAYLLGLINKKVYKDLGLIRKIRNDFGHKNECISFESQSIKDRCSQLYHNPTNFKVSARTNFIRVVIGILGIIVSKEFTITQINPLKDIEFTDEDKEGYTKFVGNLINLYDNLDNNR